MEKPKKKTFEEECKDGWWHFDPNRPFEEKKEIIRRTRLTRDMTPEERQEMLRRRYGL